MMMGKLGIPTLAYMHETQLIPDLKCNTILIFVTQFCVWVMKTNSVNKYMQTHRQINITGWLHVGENIQYVKQWVVSDKGVVVKSHCSY